MREYLIVPVRSDIPHENIFIMNFTSCNRLVLEKQHLLNNRYHRLRMDEIKRSKHKDDKHSHKHDPIKSAYEIHRQRDIQRQNGLLLNKLNSIMDKPVSTIDPAPHRQKIPHRNIPDVQPRRPNIQQKSSYSLERLEKEWRHNQEHSRMATKLKRLVAVKECSGEVPSTAASPNQNVFDNYVRMFSEMGLEEPEEDHFVEPENLAERIVIFRKAVMVDDVSYLIEVSTAYSRVFIVAYNMVNQHSRILRLRLSEEKARQVFAQYDYDFPNILSKIVIEENRISLKMPIREEEGDSREEGEKPLDRQIRFLRRNYYDLVDKHKNSKSKIKLEETPSSNEFRQKFQHSFEEDDTVTKPRSFSRRFRYDTTHNAKKFSLAVTMRKSSEKGNSRSSAAKGINQSVNIGKLKPHLRELRQANIIIEPNEEIDDYDQLFGKDVGEDSQQQDTYQMITSKEINEGTDKKIPDKRAIIGGRNKSISMPVEKDRNVKESSVEEEMEYDDDFERESGMRRHVDEEYIDDFQS